MMPLPRFGIVALSAIDTQTVLRRFVFPKRSQRLRGLAGWTELHLLTLNVLPGLGQALGDRRVIDG